MSDFRDYCGQQGGIVLTPQLDFTQGPTEDARGMPAADQFDAGQDLSTGYASNFHISEVCMNAHWEYNYAEYAHQACDYYGYQQSQASGSTQQTPRYHPYGDRHCGHYNPQAPSLWYQQYATSVHTALGDNCRGYVYDHGGSTGSPNQRCSPGTSEDSGATTPTDFSSLRYSPGQHTPIHRRTSRAKLTGKDCMVCLRPASGIHYNAATCDACKGFFRRVVALNKVYECTGDGDCASVTERSGCKACRMKRCKAAGMDPNLVKAPLPHKSTAITVNEIDCPTLVALLQSPALAPPPIDVVLG